MKHALTGIIGIIEVVYWVGYGQWITGQFSQQIETLMIVGGIIPVVLLFLYFMGDFKQPIIQSSRPNPTEVD